MIAAPPRRSIWRNWPVIVIVLASLAIATAVVLMIYPPANTAKAESHQLAPPPAPERMETNPLPPPPPPPKASQNDPWQNRPGGQIAPDDTDDPDPDDPTQDPFQGVDPFSGLGGTNSMPGLDALLRGLNTGALGGNLGDLQDQFLFTMLGRVCARAKTCGSSQVASLCGPVATLLQGAKPTTCDAGQRCLARIDALGCDALAQDDPLGTIALAQDCLQAIQGC